jgi:hypothetical protein
MKTVTPSVKETAFNCPHCGALTTQYWFDILVLEKDSDRPRPLVLTESEAAEAQYERIEDRTLREETVEWAKKMAKGAPFFDFTEDQRWSRRSVHNLNISSCYNCSQLSIWIHDRLVYPKSGEAPPPNPDMPDDIRRDYDEASRILDLSPRGAAALIRLAIQKLCKHLGQPGRHINDDIGALVKEGLDRRVQQALDAVRVIGNNAVHPGQIDLRDDRATAETLFKLLNLIVEKMISEPKHVDEVYQSLPESQLKAIEKRDGKD